MKLVCIVIAIILLVLNAVIMMAVLKSASEFDDLHDMGDD